MENIITMLLETSLFLLLSNLLTTSGVLAAGGPVTDSTGITPDRYVYFPGTEDLGQNKIRLIALGTGMPAARRNQAATCWLLVAGCWLDFRPYSPLETWGPSGATASNST